MNDDAAARDAALEDDPNDDSGDLGDGSRTKGVGWIDPDSQP